MIERKKLALKNFETYARSLIDLAEENLSAYGSMEEIQKDEDRINAYPRLDILTEPEGIVILDEDNLSESRIKAAKDTVLEGRFFAEHAAAGEATRLKLGTKFLVNPGVSLGPEKITKMLADELSRDVDIKEVRDRLFKDPSELLSLSLGERHMLQMSYEVFKLAENNGFNPEKILARQKMLVIINEKTCGKILDVFLGSGFFGFSRKNVFFMVQPAFFGLAKKDNEFFFDEESPKRLHNHGQMVMQETMDGQIFRMGKDDKRFYLLADEFKDVLSESLDKHSYNIEDLGYLTSAIDWAGLANALYLGEAGYKMVMEIVANNPARPQKGALCAFDPSLERNVMVESLQLNGMPDEKLKLLNKNFNHFPDPAVYWEALRTENLPMHITMKKGFLYFQPVQGDINFLVRTAFVKRKNLGPIEAWKSASTTIDAINAMFKQDQQPGFREYAEKVMEMNLQA